MAIWQARFGNAKAVIRRRKARTHAISSVFTMVSHSGIYLVQVVQ